MLYISHTDTLNYHTEILPFFSTWWRAEYPAPVFYLSCTSPFVYLSVFGLLVDPVFSMTTHFGELSNNQFKT